MPKLNLQELRAAMESAHVHWEADNTPISRLLATSEQSNLFGLSLAESERIVLLNEARSSTPQLLGAAPPPKKIDWRSNAGNWVTSIKDQKQCGACVSFATCAVLESRLMINLSDSRLQPDLSEAHLFFWAPGWPVARDGTFDLHSSSAETTEWAWNRIGHTPLMINLARSLAFIVRLTHGMKRSKYNSENKRSQKMVR